MLEVNEVYCMDCLEGMRGIGDGTVSLAILDLPYYRIMSDDWDRQWHSFEEYLAWVEAVCLEVRRTLKGNGSLYLFCDDHRAAHLQVMLERHFTFLNHLVWYKRNNIAIKGARNYRKYAPVSERILFFSTQDQAGLGQSRRAVNAFSPLRQYFRDFQDALGLTQREIVDAVGQSACHCFRWGSSQWALPTEETYRRLCELPLQRAFERQDYRFVHRGYEELRREYELLRRPFHYIPGMYEVIDIPIVNARDNTAHPTTKPLELIRRLVEVSSNEGDLVLDPTMGSGTTALACLEAGRNFIGFEYKPEYCDIIASRIGAARGMGEPA
jgi:site-specific DNA-methyltransferase (adenine-specific)